MGIKRSTLKHRIQNFESVKIRPIFKKLEAKNWCLRTKISDFGNKSNNFVIKCDIIWIFIILHPDFFWIFGMLNINSWNLSKVLFYRLMTWFLKNLVSKNWILFVHLVAVLDCTTRGSERSLLKTPACTVWTTAIILSVCKNITLVGYMENGDFF